MRVHWCSALVLAFAAGCLLIPSDEETGTRVANKRPFVEVTAGAANSDSAGIDYKVNFMWRGADEDGVVVRFQYATDDTTTEAAWHDTTGFSTLLKLSAAHHSPTYPEGDTLNDWHTFYIRAIDNEYASSLVAKRYFNARTIAPMTQIRFPQVEPNTAFGKTLFVEWEGEDLDSSSPDKTPLYYEYKWIRLRNSFPSDAEIVDSLRTASNKFLDTLTAGDRTRWVRVPGTTTQTVLQDMPSTGGEPMIIAVRAVDEAGAVEPSLEPGRNWVQFLVTTQQNAPTICVTERFLGQFCSDQGPSWGTLDRPIEVPAGTELRFKWTGDASRYGSKAGNSNYALDIPDPLDERYRDPNGIGGWIGWGLWLGIVRPIVFDPDENGQIHILYIRMRDQSDSPKSEKMVSIVMKVVAFQFDRTALLVDDARVLHQGMSGRDQDQIHDTFVRRFIGRINDFAPDGIDEKSLYRDRVGGNPETYNPTDLTTLKFSELARYQALLWNFNYTSGEAAGIYFHERELPKSDPRHLLSSYVGAGGKLFIFGGRPLSPMLTSIGNAGADYPKVPPQVADNGRIRFTETSFIWRFLHIRNQIVGVDPFSCIMLPQLEHQFWRDGLTACMSTNPAYPDLYLDPVKWDPFRPSPKCADVIQGGTIDWEGIWEGSPVDPDGGFAAHQPDAGLDTLYTALCSSWAGGTPSNWDGAITALRYTSTRADTLRGTAQGRVIYFLFQPYPFFEGPAIDAGTSAVNWLMTGRD